MCGFVFLLCVQNQQEVHITESEQEWRSLIEDGEEVVPLNSVDSSISNLEMFCYARLGLIVFRLQLAQVKNWSFANLLIAGSVCFVSLWQV